jgi:hypothetical protein
MFLCTVWKGLEIAMAVRLPVQLKRAAIVAGNIMATEDDGGAGGAAGYDCSRALEIYRAEVLAVMRAEVERAAPGYTLREAIATVYARVHPHAQLRVVVCDAGRPEEQVSILRSTDRLYVVRGTNRSGFVVNVAPPKNAV